MHTESIPVRDVVRLAAAVARGVAERAIEK
jgi:hypothetical protein